jgi:hypothetical protein
VLRQTTEKPLREAIFQIVHEACQNPIASEKIDPMSKEQKILQTSVKVNQGGYVEFLLKIKLDFLLGKTGAILNFKGEICISALGSILSTKNVRFEKFLEKVRKFYTIFTIFVRKARKNILLMFWLG